MRSADPQYIWRRKHLLTAAGNGDVQLDVEIGEGHLLDLDVLTVLAGALAANRTVTVQVLNEANEVVEDVYSESLASTKRTHVRPYVPAAATDIVADNKAPKGGDRWRFFGPDKIRIKGAGLATAEALTVYIRGMSSRPPTLTAGANTTLTTTEA